jgi:hypothetical protein
MNAWSVMVRRAAIRSTQFETSCVFCLPYLAGTYKYMSGCIIILQVDEQQGGI